MNQRGMVTLDFIYGLILVSGGFLVAIVIAFTLATIEVGQYIAFSTSRAYLATRFSVTDQEAAAEAKFDLLMSEKSLASFRKGDWFEFTFTGARDFRGEYSDSVDSGRGTSMLQGTEVLINAKVLGFKIPFFGSTTESGEGLSTAVNSLLGREVSDEECLNFNQMRWRKIRALAPQGQALPDSGYAVIADNGC